MYNAVTFNLPASGQSQSHHAGRYKHVYIRSSSAPFKISFDGTNYFPAKQNDRYPLPVECSKIFALSDTGAAINVELWHSLEPIQAQDTNLAIISTQVVGNFGLANGINSLVSNIASPYGGNTLLRPSVTAEGYCQLAVASGYFVTNQLFKSTFGAQQLITIALIQNAVSVGLGYGPSNPLAILDSGAHTVRILQPGEVFTVPTDDFLVLKATGDVASFTVTQVIYNRKT